MLAIIIIIIIIIMCMQENVSLLKEINDLRMELKKSRTLSHDLEAALKIARKQGFDDQTTITSTKSITPRTGLAKIEPPDNSRVVEMQKLEIIRLRAKIKEIIDNSRNASATENQPSVLSAATTVSVQ